MIVQFQKYSYLPVGISIKRRYQRRGRDKNQIETQTGLVSCSVSGAIKRFEQRL